MELNPTLTLEERNYLYDKYHSILSIPVTFIFVTRNRSPHKNPSENPLVWAIQTLERNIGKKVDEYVFVNDSSGDYTKRSIEWCVNTLGLKKRVQIINNSRRMGCSWSRQVGLKASTYDTVYFGDDDCLYKPDFLMGSLISFIRYRELLGDRLSVMNLCVFDRALDFNGSVDKNKIGQTDFDNVYFSHDFDKKPIPHIKDDVLYAPIEVGTFKGVSINSRDLLLQAGGFVDLSMWSNDYSEHLELSKRIQDSSSLIYHLPDSRISAFHLKYGANSRDKFDTRISDIIFPGMALSLGEVVRESKKERINTGARVTSEDFHISEIGSFFSFYLKISEDLAIRSATKEFENFVLNNYVFSTTPGIIDSLDKRKEIWISAIRKGVIATKQQVGEDHTELGEYIIDSMLKKYDL